MSTTDPRLLTWLGSPWSRECDICGVVTTDPERTARHKAWHALVDVLIGAFSEPGDDLAQAGRNDTDVVRADDDGAGKGSTATKTGHESDAQPAEAPGEGRGEIGPQKGAQSLGDDLREFAVELAGGTWTAFAASSAIEGFADRADALEADRSTLAEVNHEAETIILVETMRAEKAEAERDRLAADIAIMRDADLTATDVQRRRAVVAEGDRDDARAELRSLRRAAQVTTTSWREHVEQADKAERERDEARADARIWRKHVDDLAPRADKAEAAVARVRALLDRPLIPSALLRDALDGVDAGGEGK